MKKAMDLNLKLGRNAYDDFGANNFKTKLSKSKEGQDQIIKEESKDFFGEEALKLLASDEETAKALAKDKSKDEKALQKDLVKDEKGAIADAQASAIVRAMSEKDIKDVADKLGLKGKTRERAMDALRNNKSTEGLKAAYAEKGLGGGDLEAKMMHILNPAQDFLVRGDKILPFSSEDQVMGAKKGGPLDKVMGGSGGGVVNVNIYGGNQEKIYQVVRKALKSAGLLNSSG
jgi:hypothetical protein